MKNCEWLSKKMSRQQKWCGDSDRTPQSGGRGFKTYQNGRMIRDACPVACDMCFDNIPVGPTTFKLASSLDTSTFNPIDVPFCFDTYDYDAPVDASTFSDLKLVVVNEADPYSTSPLMTSNFTFYNTAESSGFCSADLTTFSGLMNATVEGTHASSGRVYTFSTSFWAGSEVATLTLVQEDGSVFTEDVTITAQSSDDSDVTSTTYSDDGTGIVRVENLPQRTIMYVAVSKDGDYGLATTVGGGERTITLVGFNEPSEIDNNDFSKGLDGWVTITPPNASLYVKIVDHVEDVDSEVGTNERRLRRRRHTATISDQMSRIDRRQKMISSSSATLLSTIPGDSSSRKMSTSNQDVELSTNGIVDNDVSLSRTFDTDPGVDGVKIRYMFITEEVPGGFYGSIYNDRFTVTVRANSSGVVISESKSMNQFALDDFDETTGRLKNWIELTAPLDLDKNGDTIQVDVTVGNVVDGHFDSTIIVDYIEEISFTAFLTRDELADVVEEYCDNPNAWKDHPDFVKYG